MNGYFKAVSGFMPVVACLLLLGSCSEKDDGKGSVISTLAVGELHAVASQQELEDFLKQGILKSYTPASENIHYLAEDDGETAGDAAAGSGNGEGFSGTYTLEQGVDEADVVKYTGTLLFVVDNGNSYTDCCIDFASVAVGGDAEAGIDTEASAPSIRVLDTNPALPSATERAVLIPTLAESGQITGLYYHEEILVSIAGSSGYGLYGDAWLMPSYWRNETTDISFFDVADSSAITESWHATISGSLVSSKRIDGVLYLVTRYSPTIPDIQYNDSNDQTVTIQNQEILDGISIGDMLPVIEDNEGTAPLFAATDCFLSANNDRDMGYSVITTITAIDMDNPDARKSTCFTGETRGIYVSENALYVTYYDWEADNTWVHKFALDGVNVDYRGSGKAEGSLGYRLESDFYLSEYQGDLRIVTSSWNNRLVSAGAEAGSDNIDHHLTILRESPETAALEVVSTLPDKEHPQAIGKPDEHLYGVRFFNDRAYLVTFETTDPLYVLDLSDPSSPVIAGELEVPGYSDFLHPVSDDLLLGIGKDAVSQDNFALYQGLKLELFDVSDISNPQSLGAISIGDRGSSSQVLYNRHAFSYLEVNENSHRFAIPVDRYETAEGAGAWDYGAWQDSGLYLFEISSVATPSSAVLAQAGSLLTRVAGDTAEYPSYAESRSFIHDNAVFFIEGRDVWSAFWDSPESVNGPF